MRVFNESKMWENLYKSALVDTVRWITKKQETNAYGMEKFYNIHIVAIDRNYRPL